MNDYFAPTKPSAKTLDELCTALQSYFEPEPIVIAERFVFYKWDQNLPKVFPILPLRCIGSLLAANLRSSIWMKFFVTILCGLHLESVQKKLLLEKDLTMAADVMKLQFWKKQTSGQRLCYQCGRNGHNADQCHSSEKPIAIRVVKLVILHPCASRDKRTQEPCSSQRQTKGKQVLGYRCNKNQS